MSAKYRLRENQYGNILLQHRNPHTRLWETVTRYSDMDEYRTTSQIQATFRGPREKARITEAEAV